MPISKIAIVIPCYNEATRFNTKYFEEIQAITDVKLFFVNDGSLDSTTTVLNEFCLKFGSQIVDLPKNIGKSNAIRSGMLAAISNQVDFKADAIAFLDADAAFTIQSVQQGVEIARRLTGDGVDVFISSRVSLSGRKIARKTHRHIIGRLIVTILGMKFKDVPYDPQSGFKIFKVQRSLLKSLESPFRTRWFGDIEILTRLKKFSSAPLKIWEEPVLGWQDVQGSKIRFRGSLLIFIELIHIMRLNDK